MARIRICRPAKEGFFINRGLGTDARCKTQDTRHEDIKKKLDADFGSWLVARDLMLDTRRPKTSGAYTESISIGPELVPRFLLSQESKEKEVHYLPIQAISTPITATVAHPATMPPAQQSP